MDVSMPRMDRIEATRLIKAEMPDVQIVGLSMYEDEQISRSMREAGAERFVTKTSASHDLLRTISELTATNKELPPQTGMKSSSD
jgi:DNA-binding NarL/FixJ family response regulator